MYYHCDHVNKEKLKECLGIYIFDDDKMREKGIESCSLDESLRMPVRKYKIVLNSGARVWNFIICPASFLYATSMEKNRKKVLETETITGIFTLKNAFFRTSSIPTAVIVLGKSDGSIWLTTALSTDDVISIFQNVKTHNRKVYYADCLDPVNFMPEFYSGEREEVDSQLDKYETKELQDIAEIISGKKARPELLGNNGIPYLRGRNLQGARLSMLILL